MTGMEALERIVYEAEIRRHLQVCREAANEGDNESANIAEFNCWRMALKAIASGHPDPARVAKLALSTGSIDFARWFS